MRSTRLKILAVLAVAAFASACGSKKEPDTLLAYVPADTPYVFTNLEPLPKAYIDTVSTKFAPVAAMYEQMLADVALELAKQPQDDLAAKVSRAMLAEIEGKMSIAGFESLGFSTQSHTAIYGIGLVPVMRVELRDTAAFEAFIARVEKRVGEPMPVGTVGDQRYWRVGKADSELSGLLAIVHGDLVLTIVPKNPSEALLEQLLGLKLPEASLADDARLTDLNKKYGFTPYGSGYLDVVRLAQALLDEKSGIEKEFLAALGETDQPTAPECRAEILAIAAKMPRMVAGYGKLEPTDMDTRMVLELEPALAAQVAKLAAPVPGLGTPSEAMVDFGMSLDLTALNEFAGAQARAVAAAPFKCPELADMNPKFAEMQSQLANPMLFAAAPVFKGFHAALTRFEMPEGGMPVLAGKIAVASDNPQSLVALGQSMMPPLASLKLAPGAAPVQLPADLAPPGTPETWVAMGEKTIGFAVGPGEQTTLPAFIAAPAATPPPLFSIGYSGKFFETLAAAGMMGVAAEPDPVEREKAERAMKMMREVYAKVMKRTDMTIVATPAGLELRQTLTLN